MTSEAASKYYCVVHWDVCRTNFPDSRDDVQLASPHSILLAPVRVANKCFHNVGFSGAHCSSFPKAYFCFDTSWFFLFFWHWSSNNQATIARMRKDGWPNDRGVQTMDHPTTQASRHKLCPLAGPKQIFSLPHLDIHVFPPGHL